MSDRTVVHMGEGSPEQVALRLLERVLASENHQSWNRRLILDTYAECLEAAKGQRSY